MSPYMKYLPVALITPLTLHVLASLFIQLSGHIVDSYMKSMQANPKESYKRFAKVTFIALWLYL